MRWVAAFVVVIVGCKKQPPAPAADDQAATAPDAAAKPAPITARPIAIVSGIDHDCALLEDGQVACWGSPLFGVLGPRAGDDGGVGIVPGVAKVKQLVAGERHTCVLVARGAVKCWGENLSGELGVPGADREVVEPIAEGAIAIAAGSSGHTCAIVGSAVKCWGENASHAVGGTDTSVDVGSPREIEGLGAAQAIVLGGSTSCVRSGPSWQCWGSNIHHQLGLAEPLKSPAPLRVKAFDGFKTIALGDQIACRLATSGAVTCLGSSHDGRRGDGAGVAPKGPPQIGKIENEKQLEDWAKGQETREADEATPHDLVGVTDVVELALGKYHGCARRTTGAVACWGTNEHGQLGDGTQDSRGKPVAVKGIDDASAISVGLHHACAIRKSGGVWCWGGKDTPRLEPVRVAL